MMWALAGAGVIVLSLAVYAVLVEPFRIGLTKVEIPIPGLPKELDGLTICHLSDTHTSRYGRLEDKIYDMLLQLRADICVITGDLFDSMAGVQALDQVLEGIDPPLGVYAVLGNGDHGKNLMTPDEIVKRLSETRINLLVNSHQTVNVRNHNLRIIGVDDPFKGMDHFGRATAGLSKNGFRLLLAHSPDILSEVDGGHVDLVLAGHTHGGQVKLPILGAIWLHSNRRIPVCDGYFDSKRLSKLLKRDMAGVRMYVSRGLGSSGITARFACPPEIALITLRTKFEPGPNVV